ncbi:embigin [Lepisosteus oculatus]|uniref:Embigin n=1 Tax=Lepisosteus oculatus TaxID=7918 RepID=W5N246_LEPOC|nr:PREDICTED: embigin [Lepisosteus oculatus]
MLSVRVFQAFGVFLVILSGTGVTSDYTVEKESTKKNVSEDVPVVSNLVVEGYTNAWLKKEVDITQFARLELSCDLRGLPHVTNTIIGYWRKDGKEIPSTRVNITWKNKQHYLKNTFHITNNSHLGNYSCVFDLKPPAIAMFVIKVPDTEGKDKPIVSYVRDSVVMYCKSKHIPDNWIWYKIHGNEQIIINETIDPQRFKLELYNDTHGSKSTITIQDLTEKDAGIFRCSAVYEIGSSEGDIHLRVLSYMEPLKPFLALAAEVIIVVSIILICEHRGKKKKTLTDKEADIELTEKLKKEETNGVSDGTTTRHRKA